MRKTLWAMLLLATLSASAEEVLKRGNGAEPKSLDPQIAEGVPEANILLDLFEGLTTHDAEANVIPGLAEKWEVSEDGKTYKFFLRKEAKWSDGQPVKASDVVFAWQRAVNPATGSTYAFLLYPVKNAEKIVTGALKDVNELGVKALDDHTLEVQLETPTPYFLGLLTHQVAAAAPQHVVEKFGKDWTQPEHMVSNGPFKLTGWQGNAQVTLQKSEHYWDKDQVKLDKVIYYPIEDLNAEMKRFRAGELDMTYEVPNAQIKWAKENLASALHIAPWIGTYYYGFNLSKPPFKDNIKLREALTLAIDRQILTEKISEAGEQPAFGFVPPLNDYPHYVPDYAKLSQKERVERAQKAYAEAGYSKDKPLKVELLYNTSENHKKLAIAVAAMWKQTLGVQTELVNQEWKVFLQTRNRKEKTQVFRSGWVGDYNDPNTFLEQFQSTAGLNDVAFNNPDYDRLLKEAGNENDPAKRFAQLAAAEKLLVDNFSLLPVYNYVAKQLVKPELKGYKENIMNRHPSRYLHW